MAYRFTNTEKWTDSWFSNLEQIQMLLFMYLCDNCDIAGFIEVNYKRWANDLNSSVNTIQGALKGLERGLIYSNTNDCIFIKNYIKHQKNLPLNENNKAHLGIIRRFELYSEKFDIKDIKEFIEGANKGLQCPSGIGNGIGIDKGNEYKKLFEKVNLEFNLNHEFQDLILIWLKYKSEKNQSYKETGLKTFIKSILKDSNSSIDLAKKMIENSMKNNYTGVFTLKENSITTPKQPNILVDQAQKTKEKLDKLYATDK